MKSSEKLTLVLGASTNPSRYSYLAVGRLHEKNIKAIPFGIKKGEINGTAIVNQWDKLEKLDIHTVTLYLKPKLQEGYIQDILDLNPRRIIFNPGTENPEFMKLAKKEGIEVLAACTLVLLSLNNY